MNAKKVKSSEENCSKDGDGVVGNDIPIRKLLVGPIRADMGDRIKAYFEQFGTVNSVEVEQEDNAGKHFALVEFKLAETAAAVLSSIEMHRINGCDVKVRAAELCQQPDHILNALNDDCLRLVLKKLNQKDLTNAANVCVRFNEEAKWVFSTKFNKLNLTKCSYEFAKYVMKTFGSLAQSIDVESKYSSVPEGGYENEIFTMIAQYCTPVLKELTINGFSFVRHLPYDVKFGVALSKLEILSLNDCHLQNSLQNLVSACGELKVLYIDCCSQLAAVESVRCFPQFNQLEELHLSNVAGLNELFLSRIIASNSTLKVLSITGTVQPDTVLSNVTETIAQKLPNLLELEFNVSFHQCVMTPSTLFVKTNTNYAYTEISNCLGRLTALKVLKLNVNKKSTEKLSSILIGNSIPIERLQLSCGVIDSDTFIKNISQMKQLKCLELFDFVGLTDEHMVQLASGLLGSKLETLHLEGSTAADLTTIGLKKMLPHAKKLSLLTLKSSTIIIDADDYKTMLTTVQKRPELAVLSIKLIGKGDQVKVDEVVLAQNRDLYSIVEQNGFKEVIYDDSNSDFGDSSDDDDFDVSDDSDDGLSSNDFDCRSPYSSDSD